jgi:hypothetical protein
MKYGKNNAFAEHGALGALIAAMALASFAFAFTACATTESKVYSSFTINGMLYDHSGSAVNGMEIKLGSDRVVKTDYSGRFSFSDVQAGNYQLKASLDGYEPFSSVVRVSSPADIIYISVFSLPDLLRSAKESMRQSQWGDALAYADRALGIEKANPRALYLKALILASRQNPARDLAAASVILVSMTSTGIEDPSVKKLLSDIAAETAAQPKQ